MVQLVESARCMRGAIRADVPGFSELGAAIVRTDWENRETIAIRDNVDRLHVGRKIAYTTVIRSPLQRSCQRKAC